MFRLSLAMLLSCGFILSVRADEKKLAETVRKLSPNVLSTAKEHRDELRRMLSTDIRARRRAANVADVNTWRSIDSVEKWEALRDRRIKALEKSLGTFPRPPADLKVHVTGTIKGDGYVIENIVFQSRPGLWVTANLYRPAKSGQSMPGIVIVHSHHHPKTQGELQDMGMIWARAGCCVLVMDQIDHGERRQHRFRTAKDFAKPFRVSRQDYYFRYNVGIQLHLIGDGLIGWMVYDIRRGIDLLLKRPGVDPKRIILLGSVAGGADPAAVVAALDKRVAALVPFNFGRASRQDITPRPKDPALSFNYFGSGSWESTRNLRLSVRDGFPPWLIDASVAPRRLIYAHEFAWDRKNDPVWKRFQSVYRLYGKPENLASVHGYGHVKLSSKEASHCNNIGEHHRKAGIYQAFEKWFGIPAPKKEYRNRIDRERLYAVEGVEAAKDITLTPVHRLADRIAAERIASVATRLKDKPRKERREILRSAWATILGDVKPGRSRVVGESKTTTDGIVVKRFVLNPEREIRIPVLLLMKHEPGDAVRRRPVVVCISQSGKDVFLKNRSEVVAKLLESGFAVCLPDLRGTGETRPGTYRGRQSDATWVSSSELMLGGTLVGQRLKDLRTVIATLRKSADIDPHRIALWGDSFAKTNAVGRPVDVPLRIDNEPDHSEPLGHLLVLLTALFEDDICAAVSFRGGLASFRSVLKSPYVDIPHDVVIPGAIAAGDLPLVAAAMAPMPLWMTGLTDGEDKAVSSEAARSIYAPAHVAYRKAEAQNKIVQLRDGDAKDAVKWLLDVLKNKPRDSE